MVRGSGNIHFRMQRGGGGGGPLRWPLMSDSGVVAGRSTTLAADVLSQGSGGHTSGIEKSVIQ